MGSQFPDLQTLLMGLMGQSPPMGGVPGAPGSTPPIMPTQTPPPMQQQVPLQDLIARATAQPVEQQYVEPQQAPWQNALSSGLAGISDIINAGLRARGVPVRPDALQSLQQLRRQRDEREFQNKQAGKRGKEQQDREAAGIELKRRMGMEEAATEHGYRTQEQSARFAHEKSVKEGEAETRREIEGIRAEAKAERDSFKRTLEEERIKIARERLSHDKAVKEGTKKGPSAGQEARLDRYLTELEETAMQLPEMLRAPEGDKRRIDGKKVREMALRKIKHAPLPPDLKEQYAQAVEETILRIVDEYDDETSPVKTQAAPGAEYEKKVKAGLAIPRGR